MSAIGLATPRMMMQRAGDRQQHGKPASTTEQQGGLVDAVVDLRIESAARARHSACASASRSLRQLVMGVGGKVLVRPIARRLRPGFLGDARKLRREVLERRQADGELAERFGVLVRARRRCQSVEHLVDHVVGLAEVGQIRRRRP